MAVTFTCISKFLQLNFLYFSVVLLCLCWVSFCPREISSNWISCRQGTEEGDELLQHPLRLAP